MDTKLAREARKLSFSQKQLMFIIGSILGDGYLETTTRGYSLRIHHGITQKEYVDFKYSLVSSFVNSKPKRSGNAYYFRTVSHPLFNQLRSIFYNDQRKKVIPKLFLRKNFDPFALAIWIMDDGAADKNQLRINTQCFSLEENLWLIKFLQTKFGIQSTINVDKGKYRLRIAGSSMNLLKKLINTYIIPSMSYKLSP
ncbi:MAG TPA: LAGLIDADG endonuclease [Patescibacteria group bacterium]|nr:LAGLIDADG endonuclease [Patescibacteria group bacterium]